MTRLLGSQPRPRTPLGWVDVDVDVSRNSSPFLNARSSLDGDRWNMRCSLWVSLSPLGGDGCKQRMRWPTYPRQRKGPPRHRKKANGLPLAAHDGMDALAHRATARAYYCRIVSTPFPPALSPALLDQGGACSLNLNNKSADGDRDVGYSGPYRRIP